MDTRSPHGYHGCSQNNWRLSDPESLSISPGSPLRPWQAHCPGYLLDDGFEWEEEAYNLRLRS